MFKLKHTVALLFICLLILSCKRQKPQLPANKGSLTDTSIVSLLTINQNLAKKEDVYIKRIALQKGKTFKRNELGFWYEIDHKGNGTEIKDSTVCKISYTLSTLNGKELQNDIKQVAIGKKQVATGLEEGLKLMKKGDSATFIIPWYLAYGMKGSEPSIPPYTSLIYKIKVFN